VTLAPSFVPGQEANKSAVSEATPIRASVPTVALSNDQIRELIRQAIDHDLVNEKRQRDRTHGKQERTSRKDGKGDRNSSYRGTYDLMFLYGEQVEHLIARNVIRAI
jgi:hypothetical protein